MTDGLVLNYISGKRLQEVICFTLAVILMVFNFVELCLHFRAENWLVIFIAACKLCLYKDVTITGASDKKGLRNIMDIILHIPL